MDSCAPAQQQPVRTCPILPSPRSTPLEHARTTALNRLHLRLGERRPPEPLGQLVAVPELSLLRLHAAQLSCGAAADCAVSLSESYGGSTAAAAVVAHHGTVLAGFLAV